MVPAARATDSASMPLAALRADQHHLVPVPGGAVRPEVDHELVHADAPDDGPARAAHQHFALRRERARPAVAVADRDGDDARVRARGPGRAVADGRARPHHLEADHLRDQRQRRADVEAAPRRRVRQHAVQHDPGPHQVQPGFGKCSTPPELARVPAAPARRAGRNAQASAKRSTCSAVIGEDGSSAQARCEYTPFSAQCRDATAASTNGPHE